MKATNHLGSLFFLLLLATLSFDGSAVDRLFFYFKNKIKKTSRERVLLRESKPKKGSYTACYYVYTFTMTSRKRRPPYFSLMLRFPMYPMDYHLRVGFLLCLNENTRHQIRLCLLTRSSLVSLSFLVFFFQNENSDQYLK